MRILVTEDEKDLADALAKGLERQGYAVDVAYDGEESLRLAEVNDYDLLILDLNLPKAARIWPPRYRNTARATRSPSHSTTIVKGRRRQAKPRWDRDPPDDRAVLLEIRFAAGI